MIDHNGGNNSASNTDNNQLFKNHQNQVRHNIFYIMLEKGIITDIARAVQYLELGGPNTTATINHFMKPLEMLLRLTNEPMPSMPLKYKKMAPQRRSQTTTSESDGNAPNSTNQQDAALQTSEQQPTNLINSEALSNNVNATVTATTSNNQNRSNTTNSDSTNAQDEQMLADDSEQNTDRYAH
jgi:hypothetical protein